MKHWFSQFELSNLLRFEHLLHFVFHFVSYSLLFYQLEVLLRTEDELLTLKLCVTRFILCRFPLLADRLVRLIINLVMSFSADKDFIKILNLCNIEKRLPQVRISSKLQVFDHLGRSFLMLIGMIHDEFDYKAIEQVIIFKYLCR